LMMLLWQMCVQRKKTEVSIMYLRGDISVLVPAVFGNCGYTYRASCTPLHRFHPFSCFE
jgi:hypothetical protein